jgi:hypothetical protein
MHTDSSHNNIHHLSDEIKVHLMNTYEAGRIWRYSRFPVPWVVVGFLADNDENGWLEWINDRWDHRGGR